jgi:hypothetical protein
MGLISIPRGFMAASMLWKVACASGWSLSLSLWRMRVRQRATYPMFMLLREYSHAPGCEPTDLRFHCGISLPIVFDINSGMHDKRNVLLFHYWSKQEETTCKAQSLANLLVAWRVLLNKVLASSCWRFTVRSASLKNMLERAICPLKLSGNEQHIRCDKKWSDHC